MRVATVDDAVDGVVPDRIASPGDERELAEVLEDATATGGSVVVVGAGTKLAFGAPPERVGTRIDLDQMPVRIEHSAGDLVVTASASTPLSVLQGELATAGQRLSIDEVVPGSTLGGVVATALAGPWRLRYGQVRDLLIGVRFVRSDGQVARAGGRVVKNVAGYDLAKLLCGSYGTLGVLTELTFRLHPLPRRQCFVHAPLDDEASCRAAATLRSSTLDVAAIELGPDGLVVLLEGTDAGVERRARAVTEVLGVDAGTVEHAPSWWARLPGPSTVKIAFAPGAGASVLAGVARVLGPARRPTGSLAFGVLHLDVAPEVSSGQLGPTVAALRDELAAALVHGGSLSVLCAPGESKAGVDVWGPVGAIALMQRVKQQFDPDRVLAPGRFVGGL